LHCAFRELAEHFGAALSNRAGVVLRRRGLNEEGRSGGGDGKRYNSKKAVTLSSIGY